MCTLGKVHQEITTTTEMSDGDTLERKDARDSDYYDPKNGKYTILNKTAFVKLSIPRVTTKPSLCRSPV